MAITIHGGYTPDKLKTMACGGTPLFDYNSGCAYYCDTCGAVIGSISQPAECVEINEDAHNQKKEWKILQGNV